jgi:predicted negative regulator of RcsB-dependent stress response
MAEIPIERKPRRSMTPLLLILLLIVLIGAGWYWWTNKNAAAGTTTSSVAPLSHVASTSVTPIHSLNFRRV